MTENKSAINKNFRLIIQEKGERFFKAVSEKVAELLIEIAEVDIQNRYED